MFLHSELNSPPLALRGSPIGSLLSMRAFDTRTTTRSKLFSLLTCLHTTTFIMLSIFSSLEMISIKLWNTPLSWQAKCSLPVTVRVSKTRARGEKRKTSGYRRLESHFHADLRVRIWHSGSDWLIFYKHAVQYHWFVWLVIPRERMIAKVPLVPFEILPVWQLASNWKWDSSPK